MTKSVQERLAAIRAARAKKGKTRPRLANQIPPEILENSELNDAIQNSLPRNYEFQVHKSIWQIKKHNAKKLALQMPEGLLMFSCILSDIFLKFCPTLEDTVILADVTYGACCIDDYTATALESDFLIHYGHSCLIPVSVTKKNLNVMYVFVDIKFEPSYLVDCIKLTKDFTKENKIFLLGTIQFASSLSLVKIKLEAEGFMLEVPQIKPLSRGEVLGCTSPRLDYKEGDVMLFIADGRFHMESAMISNPELKSFRYDPYQHKLSLEKYDSELIEKIRKSEIERVEHSIENKKFCVIQGSLGRQGNPGIVKRIEEELKKRKLSYFICLLSEANPDKLRLFDVDCFIQVCCPRLSIDWGKSYDQPMLTSYEFFVLMKQVEFKETYPQDFYAKDSGLWTNYYQQRIGA